MHTELMGYRDYDLHQKVKRAGYRIGRISDSKIFHDITPSLSELLVKRFSRAGALHRYIKIHPSHSKKEGENSRA